MLATLQKRSHSLLGDEFDKTLPTNEEIDRLVDSVLETVTSQIVEEVGAVPAADRASFTAFAQTALKPVLVEERLQWYALNQLQKQVANLKSQVDEFDREGVKNNEDMFRTKPWPGGVDAQKEDAPVRLERHDLWWKAPKTAFGETTTLQEKVRAFRHWMHVVRKSGTQQSYLQVFPSDGEGVFEPYDHRMDSCEQVSVELGVGRLLDPNTILRCVHQQWRKLQVYIDTATLNVLRIRGKAPLDNDDTQQPVARDDLWMAFSIGMQWCSRFTRLIPEHAQPRLVEYMSHMRVLVHGAIQQCLREASLDEEEDSNAVPEALPKQSLAAPGVNTMDALVAVGGVFNGMQTMCTYLRDACRSLIVAFAAHGGTSRAGFSVRARRIRRPVSRLQETEAFWKEQVGMQLREQKKRNFVSEMGRIQREFSVVRSHVRIVCAPPHRAQVWPLSVASLKRWFDDEASTDVQTRTASMLQSAEEKLLLLESVTKIVLANHAAHHPVLQDMCAQNLPMLILRRVIVLVQLFRTLIPRIPSIVLQTWSESHVTQLSEKLYGRLVYETEEESVDQEIPLPLFTMYTELTEEHVFLKRLQHFTRSKMIDYLPHVEGMQWECSPMFYDTEGEGERQPMEPSPIVKLSQRRVLSWHQIAVFVYT
jgi:hypothetical protein